MVDSIVHRQRRSGRVVLSIGVPVGVTEVELGLWLGE